jgi:hypothetical protein
MSGGGGVESKVGEEERREEDNGGEGEGEWKREESRVSYCELQEEWKEAREGRNRHSNAPSIGERRRRRDGERRRRRVRLRSGSDYRSTEIYRNKEGCAGAEQEAGGGKGEGEEESVASSASFPPKLSFTFSSLTWLFPPFFDVLRC